MEHKDADHECASRAYGRAQNENVPFGQALKEALLEIQPEIAAGKFRPIRVLQDGFVANVARGLRTSKEEAQVLLGLMAQESAHESFVDFHGNAVLEDAVELCKIRMTAFRFYEQASPRATRVEGSDRLPKPRVPPPGRSEDDVKEPGASKKAKDMAALASLYAARYANRKQEVKEFRRDVLGGRLLSPSALEEAFRSGPLSSPAAHARAQEVAANLKESYGWNAEDAKRFLLTGDAPDLASLTVQGIKKGSNEETPVEIHIVALPGTPAGHIASAYRWEQYKLLGGKDSRPLSEKGLELYEFVVDEEARAEIEGRKLSYQELMDGWERRHGDRPGYVYRDPRRFGRAVRQVEEVARRHSGTGFSDESDKERE